MKNTYYQAGNAVVISVIIVALLALGAYLLWGRGTDVAEVSPSPTMTATATPSPSASSTASPLVSVSASVSVGTVKTFTVIGKSFSFTPSQITVKKGDTVKIIFQNSSGSHDWRIDEFNAHTNVIQGGQEETIQFVADKAGSFEYYCSVGAHRQLGMKGTLTVQ